MSDYNKLTLKWGTLKAWDFHTDKGLALLQEYCDIGASGSAMAQQDTDRQKKIIFELINECDDPRGIYLDWDGKYVSKDEAKEYVTQYRQH